MNRLICCLSISINFVSCNCTPHSSFCEQTVILCDRNEYSKNGVESVSEYVYDTKEGKIDYTTKKLYKYEMFDSLGNSIYYKGQYYPNINEIPISDFHYAIIDYYRYPYSSRFSYKMDYDGFILRKISVFDEAGCYIAKVDHCEDWKSAIDSVYAYSSTSNTLIYVHKRYNNIDGLDSLSLHYGLRKYKLVLDEKKITQYKWINDSTLQTKSKSTNFLFPGGPLTSISTHTNYYNITGELIQRTSDKGYVADLKYDEHHHNIETHSKYKSEINTERHVYDARELLMEYYWFVDNSICKEYHTYEYTYYSYSPWNKTISK